VVEFGEGCSEFFGFFCRNPAVKEVGAFGFTEEGFGFFEVMFAFDNFFPAKEVEALFFGESLNFFFYCFCCLFGSFSFFFIV